MRVVCIGYFMSHALPLRIVFAGTPEFAAQHLDALVSSHHELVGVYTQPDRPAGRGKKLQASPVKQRALAAGLQVYQPQHLKDAQAQQQLAELNADIMVVVAYGLLLPQTVLDMPRLGCINVHASILPRWRGAAPIQRAIEAGDAVTGITIMQMDAGLDTGQMLSIFECPITPTDTALDLHDRLAQIGPQALLQTLDEIARGEVHAETQDDQLATYARKLDKQEAQINWQEPAAIIARRIRAFNPFPVAYTLLHSERLRIYQAHESDSAGDAAPGTVLENHKQLVVACGDGTALALDVLQLPGKKALPITAVLNGMAEKLSPGTKLGAL